MSLLAQNSGNADFETCPAGLQNAVCYCVEDIGWQPNPFAEKPHHQIVVLFETENRMADNRRFGLSKFYTLSLHEKAGLRKDLIAWRGQDFTKEELAAGFDVEKLVGANCALNVIHEQNKDGGTRAKIAGIMPAMKDRPKMVCENHGSPEWVKKKIAEQVGNSSAATPVQPPKAPKISDDLPF